MRINFIFLLFLLLICFNTASAMELAEIELVNIDTLQVEKNETLRTEHITHVERGQINIENPLDPMLEGMIGTMTTMIIIFVGFTMVFSMVGSLSGRNRGRFN